MLKAVFHLVSPLVFVSLHDCLCLTVSSLCSRALEQALQLIALVNAY